MSRLPAVNHTDNPEIAGVFDEIKSSRGFVSNALRSLAHSPEALKHFARLGEYVKYKSSLDDRLRELVILTAARGVAYEWNHHAPLALQAGIAQDAIDDIGAQRVPTSLPVAEQAIVQAIGELFTPEHVSDAAFKALRAHWSPLQITDIIMSATYYRALGTAVSAMRIEIESDEVLQVERDWQKKVISQ